MSIRAEQLIALSDEIAALSRAGVPLEKGLACASHDLPGEFARVSRKLAERLTQGESLVDALGAEEGNLPPLYRAVVTAGLRSGRLAAALEALATSARRMSELRRIVGLACWYPFIVLLVAYGLLVLFSVQVAPTMLASFESFRINTPAAVDLLARAGSRAELWGPIAPAMLFLAVLSWWYLTGRAQMVEYGPAMIALGWVPRVRRMVLYSQSAMLAELAALLVRQEVPLGEALRLSAEATGNPVLGRSAAALADKIEKGEFTAGPSSRVGGLPPLLQWLVTTGAHHGALTEALDHAAESYHRRALHQVDLVRTFLPVWMTVVIGGGATLLVALLTYLPFLELLRNLTDV